MLHSVLWGLEFQLAIVAGHVLILKRGSVAPNVIYTDAGVAESENA